MLEKILQFKVLQNKYSTSDVFRFIKEFKTTKGENKYINTTTASDFINELANQFHLPLTNYFLSETQIIEQGKASTENQYLAEQEGQAVAGRGSLRRARPC